MGLINNIGAWFEKLVDGWTFGSQDYKMTFKGNATIEGSGGGYEHIFPPKSGTVALLDDIAGGSINLGLLLGLYRIDTNTTPPPASGDIKYDNSTQISATNLYVHNLTDPGTDINKVLALISEGSIIYIQRVSISTDYQLWEVTGTPSYSAPYFTFPVTLISSGGEGTSNFQNNREVVVGLVNAASSGSQIGGNALQATFDGMGAVVLVNSIAYVRARSSATIVAYSIIAEGTSPTCTVDILKIASGTVLPSVSITAAATPQLTTGNAIKSTVLTGWNTAIDSDDILAFKVTACANATKIVIQLYIS